jgi:hypothetical protein
MNAPTVTPDQRLARGVSFIVRTIGSSPARELEITDVLAEWVAQNRELAQALSWPELLEQLGAPADQAGYVTAEQRLDLDARPTDRGRIGAMPEPVAYLDLARLADALDMRRDTLYQIRWRQREHGSPFPVAACSWVATCASTSGRS